MIGFKVDVIAEQQAQLRIEQIEALNADETIKDLIALLHRRSLNESSREDEVMYG